MRENARMAFGRKLLDTGWLKEKPTDFQQILLQEARIQRYGARQYTHHIGDDPGGFYGIIEGSFGVITDNPTAGTVMGHVMRRGDWFGQRPMLVGKSRSLAFRAMEDSIVLYVSLQAVDQISRSISGSYALFASLAEHNLEVTVTIISDLLIRRSDKRIAAVLLRVAGISKHAPVTGVADCTLTQSDLAELANVSRHVVNSTLGLFENKRWIKVGYGKISILAPKKLIAFLAIVEEERN